VYLPLDMAADGQAPPVRSIFTVLYDLATVVSILLRLLDATPMKREQANPPPP